MRETPGTPSRSHTLSAFGFEVAVPGGWDIRVGVAPAGPHGASNFPIVHAANFALPARRQDFGGEVVAAMAGDQVFVALLGYGPGGGHGLFAPVGLPQPLDADWFDPWQMQRPVPGRAGVQRFFTAQQKKFCLYAVVGSYAQRSSLVAGINRYLAGVTIHP